MKIIDKINQVYAQGGTTVSFEFFPAKTEDGVFNLLNRVEEMGYALQPTFVTLTWRSAFKDESLWLKIGSHIQNQFKMDVLLHLTCHLPEDQLKLILNRARQAGIQNILALRGDPPIGADKWKAVDNGFKNAVKLIELIRREHGDYFCIACAGYPEVHTESWNNPNLPPSEQAKELDLLRLLEKQQAGADFIISQFFFDVDNTIEWIARCRAAGITIPILPGYLPIQNYNSFKKFTHWCKTSVPSNVLESLNAIQSDDAQVKQYGIQLAIETCQTLAKAGGKSLHFYTMNLASAVTKILQGLDLIPKLNQRDFPWKSNQILSSRKSRGNNKNEEIRPIFWANRQASYISRTSDWDDFPNGRWGDRKSPAYGELTEYYLAYKRPKADRILTWGTPTCFQDIANIFVGYLDGTVRQLPWCEQGLSGESTFISENLKWINSCGFLSINSQPRVNGIPSNHPSLGWGGPDGIVFQKAYIEFFCSPENMKHLLTAIQDFPNLSYHAMNLKGEEFTNSPDMRVNAVTWGVFPNKEILQPTVVDPASFVAWKDEAFELWMSQWASAYEPSSSSHKVVKDIYETFYLVNIVDNDYINDNASIFSIFKRVITNNMGKEELRSRVDYLETINEKLQMNLTKLQVLHKELSNEVKRTKDEHYQLEMENNNLNRTIRDLKLSLAMK